MKLLGLDPGLQRTGWGVIETDGNRLHHVANGVVATTASRSFAERLCELHDGLNAVLDIHAPDAAAVEETFVNKNPSSTLRLGQARGICLLAPASRGIAVAEYAANLIKKTVVGTGHAAKGQVRTMVLHLLPGCEIAGEDAADALAVAICHAHHNAAAGWRGRAVVMAGAGAKEPVA